MHFIPIVLTKQGFGANTDLVTRMHQLRARVFKDRLKWDVSVAGDMEIDNFDVLDPEYLLITTQERDVIAHARLLPTTGSYMLADAFPVLLGSGPPPRDSTIIESSRFCVDTDAPGDVVNGLHIATFAIFSLALEWCLMRRYSSIVTVVDATMERVLRRAGWPLARIASPAKIGDKLAVAGYLEVSTTKLEEFAALSGYAGLRNSGGKAAIAA
jgi:acyl homoserine lactone synthase